MGFSRKSLVALTFATLARATPLFAEPLFGRDLVVRQGDPQCNPNGYTSLNGLNFTTYCGQNNPFNDAPGSPFTATSANDCMEHCSRFWGNNEGCFGMVYRETDSQCWLRTSNVTTATLAKLDGHVTALVDRNQMKGGSNTCPYPDNSVQTLDGVDGLAYTVNCGKDIGGSFDTCFDNYPCFPSPWKSFYHTSTLDACVKICTGMHPLCKGVVWNPGLEIGYANCWMKNGFPSPIPNSGLTKGTFHSATITSIDTVDNNCPSSKQIKATGNKAFDLHCGQLNTGTNITSVHTQNVTACINECATSNQKCIGIVFDSSLSSGFKNCYLQNTTNTISDKAIATYALLANTPLPSGSNGTGTLNPGNSSNSSSSSSSSSKAWIAGPVIGGLAAIGIIVFAIFFFRKRKANKAAGGVHNAHEKDSNPYAGHYQPAPAYPGSPGAEAPVELEQSERRQSELPGSTKYAATKKGSSDPVELP